MYINKGPRKECDKYIYTALHTHVEGKNISQITTRPNIECCVPTEVHPTKREEYLIDP